MVSLKELPLLALGVVVSVGLGFLFWALFHLTAGKPTGAGAADRLSGCTHVVFGYRLPRAACSRSMASNSALKLPFPKLRLPFRWMISKNSVGRSSTGLVKICSM